MSGRFRDDVGTVLGMMSRKWWGSFGIISGRCREDFGWISGYRGVCREDVGMTSEGVCWGDLGVCWSIEK